MQEPIDNTFVDPNPPIPEHTVPKDIHNALKNGKLDGFPNGEFVLMAWGVTQIVGSNDADSYGKGWIRMKVTGGSRWNGHVRVCLNYDGTYNLFFENLNNRIGNLGASIRLINVPQSDLLKEIDQVVEGVFHD